MNAGTMARRDDRPADGSILDRLERRRSVPAARLDAPGPTPDEVRTILTVASRVPDHGALTPWRFIVVEGAARTVLAERLAAACIADAETPEALMARVDRLGAAMDRLLASIEAPPESQERGGASGEELLKRLYALRDAQTRLLERIARIEAPPIPLPPPSPPEERLASAPSGDGPVLAPAPAADAAE